MSGYDLYTPEGRRRQQRDEAEKQEQARRAEELAKAERDREYERWEAEQQARTDAREDARMVARAVLLVRDETTEVAREVAKARKALEAMDKRLAAMEKVEKEKEEKMAVEKMVAEKEEKRGLVRRAKDTLVSDIPRVGAGVVGLQVIRGLKQAMTAALKKASLAPESKEMVLLALEHPVGHALFVLLIGIVLPRAPIPGIDRSSANFQLLVEYLRRDGEIQLADYFVELVGKPAREVLATALSAMATMGSDALGGETVGEAVGETARRR